MKSWTYLLPAFLWVRLVQRHCQQLTIDAYIQSDSARYHFVNLQTSKPAWILPAFIWLLCVRERLDLFPTRQISGWLCGQYILVK